MAKTEQQTPFPAPLTQKNLQAHGVKRTWAKDLWHLCHRVIRKILSHTALVVVNLRAGHPPLQLDALAA